MKSILLLSAALATSSAIGMSEIEKKQIEYLKKSLSQLTSRPEAIYNNSDRRRPGSYISFNDQQAKEWRMQLDALLQQQKSQ
jgi:selenocysteine lyase/cysteine desulfurase